MQTKPKMKKRKKKKKTLMDTRTLKTKEKEDSEEDKKDVMHVKPQFNYVFVQWTISNIAMILSTDKQKVSAYSLIVLNVCSNLDRPNTQMFL